jgi:hypothetical protein
MWMPRYLGVIWPAFAIAVAVLLSRLPTRPLRWTAIALLVLVNLGQFSARVFATSEPPVDRMARDLIEAQPDDATMRTYYRVGVARIGAPGNSLLTNMPGVYYLAVYGHVQSNPQEMLWALFRDQIWDKFKRWPRFPVPLEPFIASDASRNPQLKRIVVWDKLDGGGRAPIDMNDKLGERLGTTWKRASEELYRVRDHWTWRELFTVRRREYVRLSSPATAPATAPAIAPATAPTSMPSRSPTSSGS